MLNLLITYAACLSCCLTTLCATSPAPFALQIECIDKIAGLSNNPTGQREALQVLKKVALGHSGSVTRQEELSCSLAAGQLNDPAFAESVVRAEAFRVLGRFSAPEALEFLHSMKLTDFDIHTANEVWPAIQIAVHEGLLWQTNGSGAKGVYLERLLQEEHDPISNSKLRYWAINQICDLGLMVSFPVAREALLRDEGKEGAQGDIAFCQARMNIVASSTDRVQSLSSALKLNGSPPDSRLLSWVIDQLASMDTAEAGHALAQAAAQIDSLREPERTAMASFRDHIQRRLSRIP